MPMGSTLAQVQQPTSLWGGFGNMLGQTFGNMGQLGIF